jgi:hypothetical protein
VIDVKVNGNALEFKAKGSTEEILEDAVKVVIAACESLSHNSVVHQFDDTLEDDFKNFLLKKAIVKLIKVQLGEAELKTVIIDPEAVAKEMEGNKGD